MRLVDQMVFEIGKGDCLAACIASILEMPLWMVPNFGALAEPKTSDAEDELLYIWLKRFGLKVISLHFGAPSVERSIYFGTGDEFLIAWGRSPRLWTEENPVSHAVVVKPAGWGLELVHDPHPSRAGIEGPFLGCMWIVKRTDF